MHTVETVSQKDYMEEITDRCANLKLSLREDVEVEVQTPPTEESPVLVGKFCTKRRINLESVARVLRSVWKTQQNFEVSDLGENKVLFLFQSMDDLDRVLLLSPWSFDKYLVILHKLVRGEAVKDITFERSMFWIQIHGLPTMCQTKDIGTSIGATLGEVMKVDANGKGFCLGNYLRVRISLDVSLPLCRGRKVRLGEYGLKWIEFRYERLPIFCYLCGKVDHEERDCLQWIRSNITLRPEEKQYGPWLRAQPEKNQKPQLVVVEKQNVARTGEGGEQTAERGVSGATPPTTATGRGRDALSTSPAREEGSRADVEEDVADPANVRIKIPEFSLDSNFEQQIKEIDDAINGNVPCLISGAEEELMGGKEPFKQTGNVAITEREARMSANRPHAIEQAQLSQLGPPEFSHKPIKTNVENSGLIQTEVHFNVGLSSPKHHKVQGAKKNRAGSLKKFKENRGTPGMDNSSGSEVKHLQGTGDIEDSAMEFELVEMGTKRRARTPLAELDNMEDNGKRMKREGEIQELGKLLAQHLGSAEAASQPRRAQ